jgi:hypothetical protein
VILGEIIHDLRSSLDHVVWQLVIANGSLPGYWNQFPIFSEGSLAGWVKKDFHLNSSGQT